MNNHKKFEEFLQGYLDNVLNKEEKAVFEKHLKTCKICKQKLEERKNLLKNLRLEKEEIECPEYLIDKILKNTTQKQPKTIINSRTIRWRYMAVGAAAVFIVVSTVLINTIDNQKILTTNNIIKNKQREPFFEETEPVKGEEKSLEKRETLVRGKEKTKTEQSSKSPIEPNFSLSEEKTMGETKKEEITKETPMPNRAAKPSISWKIEKRDFEQRPFVGYESEKDKEPVDFVVDEETLASEGFSEDSLTETHLVFPEEGSVVGEDFEIVLILKDPNEKIEISLDGEQITNYKKTIDSNIIFIESDSFPALEEGLHFISVFTTKEESLTFYKEG